MQFLWILGRESDGRGTASKAFAISSNLNDPEKVKNLKHEICVPILSGFILFIFLQAVVRSFLFLKIVETIFEPFPGRYPCRCKIPG